MENPKIYQEPKCPKCSLNINVVPIEYGFPGNEMQKEYYKGKIRLGGCSITDDNPEWYCKACRYEWQTDQPDDGRFSCAECSEIEENCLCELLEED